MLKKKIWADFHRIIELFTLKIVTKLSKIWVWDPGSGKKPIPDPGSRIKGSKRPRFPDLEPQHWLYTVLMCLLRYRTGVLDEEVVGVMADHYGLTRQAQAEQLLAWQYDTLTATYFLLLARRQAGKQFRILQPNPDLKPLPDLIADKVTFRV
jgi:hypothetical protein